MKTAEPQRGIQGRAENGPIPPEEWREYTGEEEYLQERYEPLVRPYLGGQPFTHWWVDHRGYLVLEFPVLSHLVRPDCLDMTGRQLRRLLWRHIAGLPELRSVWVFTQGSGSGVRYFQVYLPWGEDIRERISKLAAAVQRWLAVYFPAAG